MSTVTRPHTDDPRLRPFLDARTEESASAALDSLLHGEPDRVVRDSVRRALGESGIDASHLEDIASQVRLGLVRRLWSRRNGGGEPIENFLGYAVGVAENECYGFLRRRYPERTRFRNRVRYATSHHPGTMLEKDARGVWQCRTRRTGGRTPQPGATRAFLDDPHGWVSATQLETTLPLPALIDALLARLDRQLELDRLVEALATILGIVDTHRLIRRAAPAEEGEEEIPDPAPGIGDLLQQRESLERVWSEIVELPPRQRAALLLNLRDPDGGGILQMLPATGAATAAAIAAALGMETAELETLWGTLPLDDLSIAVRLGLTRQQIINLRKAARARLARRLGGRI